jgi:hypothetical protein
MVMISRIILEVRFSSSIAMFFIGQLKVFVLFLAYRLFENEGQNWR